ncbi:hypothetical protein HMPREF0973_01848 [Prevotella veroralis F0319]|uniref:Uncharacterized protein n=1 Tax=Prevotella veroralis F0319 TaxID=649761 RepID=C9MQE9_9BACT|nr:hypothetical protein HMPREF0973_01848 [Prevotella veroralis F0319]
MLSVHIRCLINYHEERKETLVSPTRFIVFRTNEGVCPYLYLFLSC